MYRIVAICDGVSPSCGEEAARDITSEFVALGDEYHSAQCDWNGKELVLRAESESDEDGEFTADWFYRSVFACARELAPSGGVSIQSVEQVAGGSDDLTGTEDEGYELLSQATKLERAGQVQKALLAYQRVADLHPHNGAGHDAKISIESLRTKIGSDRNA